MVLGGGEGEIKKIQYEWWVTNDYYVKTYDMEQEHKYVTIYYMYDYI